MTNNIGQQSFFNYKNYRWFWINLLLLTLLIFLYCLDNPIEGRGGGTYLGYTYGIFAALAIVYLMWFGIRKRSYYSTNSTALGWLAVHIWLGIALAVIVPLHSGLRFHLNVHTLAYVLMLLTIASGIFGAIMYDKLAPLIQSHRGGGNVKKIVEDIETLEGQIKSTSLGKSATIQNMLIKINPPFTPSIRSAFFYKYYDKLDKDYLSSFLSNLDDSESEQAMKLVALVKQKDDLCKGLRREIKTMTILRGWLYLHLAFSFGLLASLMIHILSVLIF